MHPEDNKMHCLCSDKKSPQNGACPKPKQGKQKCPVLIYRDILLEGIYVYFYKKTALALNTSHTTKRAVQGIPS
jgi:hypothetical protein